MSRMCSPFHDWRLRVALRLALVGPLLLVSLGGSSPALGAVPRPPVSSIVAAVPALGDLVVPVDQLGPGWTEIERQEPGDAAVLARYTNEGDYLVPREATFWVKVAPTRAQVRSPIAVAQDLTGSSTLAVSLVDLDNASGAVKTTWSSPDSGLASVGFAFVVDRANGFVAVQGDPAEQADLEDQALAFANLQADRLQGGLPEVKPSYSPGQVILSDNFDDPARGQLARESGVSRFRTGYEDGEYVIARIDPTAGSWNAGLPGTYTDTTVAVDVRFVGDPATQAAGIHCRNQGGSYASHYRLSIRTDTPKFSLARWDGSNEVPLKGWTASDAIKAGGAWNHLEFTCSGDQLAASINGTPVVSVRDGTYTSGRVALFGGGFAGFPVPTEAHFDNLVLTAPLETIAEPAATPVPTVAPAPPAPAPTPAPAPPAPAPTPAPPAVGTILLADNFDDPGRGMFPQTSPEPEHFTRGYEGGEYVLRVVDPAWGADYYAMVNMPGIFSDATLSVDARIVDPVDTTNWRVIVVQSRGQLTGLYRLYVSPFDGMVRFVRRDANGWATLVDWQPAPSIRKGNEWNKIELTCAGSRITASINGAQVFTVQDSSYKIGIWSLLAGSEAAGKTEARFNNLVLTAAPAS